MEQGAGVGAELMPACASSQGSPCWRRSPAGAAARKEGAQPLGNELLGPVHAGEGDAAPVGNGVGHHRTVLKCPLQRRHHPVGRHLDQRRRELDGIVLAQSAMALGPWLRRARGKRPLGCGSWHPCRCRPSSRSGRRCGSRCRGWLAQAGKGVSFMPRTASAPEACGSAPPARCRPVRVQKQHDLANDLLPSPAGDDAAARLLHHAHIALDRPDLIKKGASLNTRDTECIFWGSTGSG